MQRRRLEGTQRQWVEKELLAGKKITHVDLIKAAGGDRGWRLGAIIRELVLDNWPIRRVYSGLRRIATYWIDKGWQPGGPVQQELAL